MFKDEIKKNMSFREHLETRANLRIQKIQIVFLEINFLCIFWIVLMR
jgi:hypothetical protein